MTTSTGVGAAHGQPSSAAQQAAELANLYSEGHITADEYYARMDELADLALEEELHDAAERRLEASRVHLAVA